MNRDLVLALIGGGGIVVGIFLWRVDPSPRLIQQDTQSGADWTSWAWNQLQSTERFVLQQGSGHEGERLTVLWDYSCEVCEQGSAVLDSLIRQRPSLRVEVVPVPLVGVSEGAEDAVEAVMCAAERTEFRIVHGAWTARSRVGEDWAQIADREPGIDGERLGNCIEAGRQRANVWLNLNRVQAALIPGLPFFITSSAALFGSPTTYDLAALLRPEDRSTDSSGVEVVTNARTAAVIQRIADKVPTLVLGGGDDDEVPLYGVVAAFELSGGSIVVGNAGTNQILYFGRTGQLQHATGGNGMGPGEFRWLRALGRQGSSSVWAYDQRLRRVSWFRTDGSLIETEELRLTGDQVRQPQVLGTLEDRSLVISEGAFQLITEGPSRVYREAQPIYRVSPGAETGDEILSVRGMEFVVLEEPRNPPGAPPFTRSPRVFGRKPLIAVLGNTVLHADNGRFEFSMYDEFGHPLRIVRRWYDSIGVSDVDVAEEARMSGRTGREEGATDSSRRWAEARMERAAEVLPALERIFVARDGRVWVSQYHWPKTDLKTWSIFTTSGILDEVVLTPPDVTVTDAGRNWIIGTWKNELGIEYVSKHRLIATQK